MSKLGNFACATAIGLGSILGAAHADEKTTNLAVAAVVLESCTVTAPTALGFGNLDTATAASETVPGSIVVVCSTAKTGVTVTLGAGGSASGGVRHMSDGASATIPYNIYSDATHSDEIAIDGQIWGGNLTAVTPQNIPVYGTIPAGNYSSGTYSDTVLVTLTY